MDKRILLVSENNILQTTFRANFEREGFATQCCINQPTALNKVTEWRPQIIIIDEALTNEEGLKIAKAFNNLNQLPVSFVIMLAESMETRKLKAAYKAGVDFYILKQGTDFRALMLTLQTIYRQLNNNITLAEEATRISA